MADEPMEDHFCPNCGTEIDADARFCPTCGLNLSEEAMAEEVPPLPEAPDWPPAPLPDEGAPAVAVAGEEAERQPAPVPEPEPERQPEPEPEPRPAPDATEAPSPPPPAAQPVVPASPPPPAAPATAPATGGPDLPITWPTMLSGWLIGIGAAFGALSLIPRLGDVLSVLLFLGLLGVAASVFLADRIPEIPRLRLYVLVVALVGLGMALERAAFTVRGIETLLLLAMLAVAGGAILVELDRDRPLPPPASPGA